MSLSPQAFCVIKQLVSLSESSGEGEGEGEREAARYQEEREWRIMFSGSPCVEKEGVIMLCALPFTLAPLQAKLPWLLTGAPVAHLHIFLLPPINSFSMWLTFKPVIIGLREKSDQEALSAALLPMWPRWRIDSKYGSSSPGNARQKRKALSLPNSAGTKAGRNKAEKSSSSLGLLSKRPDFCCKE